MAVWQYTFFIVPRIEVEKKYHRIPQSVDAQFLDEFVGWEGVSMDSIETLLKKNFGPRYQSSYGPVIFGHVERSCIKLLFNSSVLENVTVRLDLRQEVADQLRDAILLCNELDGVIVTAENKTIRSHEDDLIAEIKESSAIKFVKDPLKFLDSLNPKK